MLGRLDYFLDALHADFGCGYAHRPSIKGTKLHFIVIKAIIIIELLA
jgi:hypothetical protein